MTNPFRISSTDRETFTQKPLFEEIFEDNPFEKVYAQIQLANASYASEAKDFLRNILDELADKKFGPNNWQTLSIFQYKIYKTWITDEETGEVIYVTMMLGCDFYRSKP